MSWTQGVKIRADYSEESLVKLDKQAKSLYGPAAIFDSMVWDEVQPTIITLQFRLNERDDAPYKWITVDMKKKMEAMLSKPPKNPRPYEEVMKDTNKKFSKTLDYLKDH